MNSLAFLKANFVRVIDAVGVGAKLCFAFLGAGFLTGLRPVPHKGYSPLTSQETEFLDFQTDSPNGVDRCRGADATYRLLFLGQVSSQGFAPYPIRATRP